MMVFEAAAKFEEAKALFAKGGAGDYAAFATGCLVIGHLYSEWCFVKFEGKPGTKARHAAYAKADELREKIWAAQAAICLTSLGVGFQKG